MSPIAGFGNTGTGGSNSSFGSGFGGSGSGGGGGSGSSLGGGSSFTTGGGESVAQIVLKGAGICAVGSAGSNLPGYDIRSQDAMSMLRLSLLASSDGKKFIEVYGGPDGCARYVHVGTSSAGTLSGPCLFDGGAGVHKSRIDNVVVTGRDPLPIRYHGGSVNITGGGYAQRFTFPSSACQYVSDDALTHEAWAVFSRDGNSQETKDALKALVKRSKWEQLIGYKITFPPVPRWATMSMSQTTPFNNGFTLSNVSGNQSISVQLAQQYGEGGIVDISNIQLFGSQVLDIVNGADLLAGSLGADIRANSSNPADPDGFSEDDYYVLLDHQCGLHSLSRGQDWFLLGSPGATTANLLIRQGEGSYIARQAFYGFGTSTTFMRRYDDTIGSMQDAFELARNTTGNPLDYGEYGNINPFRGRMILGFKGASLGFETFSSSVSYSAAWPSVAIKSNGNDAYNIAAQFAAAGIVYTAIILQDTPAKIAVNGTNIRIPTPPDEEGTTVDFDTPLDNMNGTVIDISAPFLDDPSTFCRNLRNLINSETSTTYRTKIYARGGYNLLPGMAYAGSSGAIQTVEFKYTHGGEQTSQVTIGPIYYPIGGFSDSQYVKRSETITRTAKIVSGSNQSGVFQVYVDGLGHYDAINGILNPLYPGDRVEVRLLNVPIEK